MDTEASKPKNTGIEIPEKIDSFEGALEALKTVVDPDSENKQRLQALKALVELAKNIFSTENTDDKPNSPPKTPPTDPNLASIPAPMSSSVAPSSSAPEGGVGGHPGNNGPENLKNKVNNTLKNDKEVLSQNFNHVLCAGSSSLNMMAGFCENIVNLSQSGAPSRTILSNLQNHPERFRGVDTLIAQYGLNNNYEPDRVINDLNNTIDLAQKNGVKKIVVLTGFPFDHRLRSQKKSFVERGIELKDRLKKVFSDSSKVSGVQIDFLDFYELYAYKEGDALPDGYQVGDLKEEYEKEKPEDLIHPPRALAQKGMAHVLRLV